ncbi:MAG: SdpI family protein [Clostridia bacterium]|nr:SdpI family protein [Clostridia bacterium]
MKIKFVDGVYWVLAFLPLVVTGAVYRDFPQSIPVHFNAALQIDKYGSRTELFIFPIAIIGIAALFWIFLAFINKVTGSRNDKLVQALKLIVMITFAVICISILFVTYRSAKLQTVPDFYKIVAVLLSLGDIVMANYLPKCKRNGWMGIRTSWTLSSDEVWYKTHRFGGWLIAIGGVLCIVVSLILKGIACLMTVCVAEIVMLIIVVVYSYKISKKVDSKNE